MQNKHELKCASATSHDTACEDEHATRYMQAPPAMATISVKVSPQAILKSKHEEDQENHFRDTSEKYLDDDRLYLKVPVVEHDNDFFDDEPGLSSDLDDNSNMAMKSLSQKCSSLNLILDIAKENLSY
ncbi:hypothetical protein A0H81_07314 [Grifola frondosa]|uniref:Uncharacterized protein n=1 Tax=Grifola frondosa TaxID=5627 RepID=A0A1C7M767_GRIFR|nr:hypothetical protein A0H81_07314 [Grifola frondosa]